MSDKINYTSESLLDLVFAKNVKGYDSDQVDTVLDEVIEDYAYYEKFRREATPYIVKLEKRVTELKEQVRNLEVELARYKNRLEGIKENANVSSENIDLLKRITSLEQELYRRGVDPSRIK